MARRNLRSILFVIGIVAGGAVGLSGCIWAFLYFVVYLGYGNYKVYGHREFASNGVSQIAPAVQMDRSFADCRHYITYGPSDVPLFNSVAYFGDRYVLTMQVPVAIESPASGSMIGEPQFYLDEVGSIAISPSGQVVASFSRNMTFGWAQWQQVYDANGDFGAIGFTVNTFPVPNFQKYADAGRPSN